MALSVHDPDWDLAREVVESDPVPADEREREALLEQLGVVRSIVSAFDDLDAASDAGGAPPRTQWGPFLLREQIGRGRYGAVCRAFDPAVDRDVAVKLYTGVQLPAEPRLMARVQHPNVVTVFGAAVYEGQPGIWMELVEGRTLAERLECDGPLSPAEVVRIGLELCHALAAVHGAGLLHQDVKLRNVMERHDGRVVLMDFGAGLLTDSDPETRRLVGTPLYMSPEVLLGASASVQSDVYSLGVLLYYLLTGTYPVYAPDVAELRRVHERHHRAGTRRFVAALRELRPECSTRLARVLAKALAPARQRYKTAAELAIAIQALQRSDTDDTRGRRMRFAAAAVLLLSIGLAMGRWSNHAAAVPTLVFEQLTSDRGLTIDPAVSPDGKLLAYASDRGGEGNLDIWIQQMAGGEPLRITHDTADESQPSFSPDGSTIAFRSEREGGGIYVVSSLGGEARLLVRNGRWPRFSPDGRQIAYIGKNGTNLVVVSSEGQISWETSVHVPPESIPVWAPDSQHILLLAPRAVRTPIGIFSDWDWMVLSVGHESAVWTGASAALISEIRVLGDKRPSPSHWQGDRILFDAPSGDTRDVWEIAISPTFQISGPARRLTASTEAAQEPSRLPDGRIVFATNTGAPGLWQVPLDGKSPEPSRALIPLSIERLWRGTESLSDDGRWLVFPTHHGRIHLKDLALGRELPISATTHHANYPVISRDGMRVFYQSAAETNAIYSVGLTDSVVTKICDACGFPTDVSPDGQSLFVQQAFTTGHASIGRIDLSSGRHDTILADHQYEVYRAHVSPDGHWIAFHAANRRGTQEFVARLQGPNSIPFQNWIAVTDGRTAADVPRWSLDGNLLYHISNRDGARCVWAQRLDPSTKAPVGEPFAVFHSHGRQSSLANMPPGTEDVLVGRGVMIVTLGELKGNIWSAAPPSPLK